MIDISQQGEVAVVTMRHGKVNAMDVEFCEGLAARFEELKKSKAKAVVLTGEGKIFSAGVDLVRALDGGPDYFHKFLPALSKAFVTVFFFPKPVVAAVNGHAVAGGCVLACCADKRIAARDGGRIGVTELLVGVPFPALAFEVMRFATPPAFFAETILSGATYPPDVALARRMVDELAEPEGLLDRAVAAAQTLAALS